MRRSTGGSRGDAGFSADAAQRSSVAPFDMEPFGHRSGGVFEAIGRVGGAYWDGSCESDMVCLREVRGLLRSRVGRCG